MNNKLVSLLFSFVLLLSSLTSCTKGGDDTGTTTVITNPLSLEVVETSGKEFTVAVSIDPVKKCDNYIVGVIPQDVMDAQINGDNDIVNYVKETATEAGADFAKVDNKYIFNGEQKVNLNNGYAIEFESSYTVVAFGVNAKGEVYTRIAKCSATTDEQPLEDLPMLDLSIDNTTPSTIEVSVILNPIAPFKNYIAAPISNYYFEEEFNSNKLKTAAYIVTMLKNMGSDLSQANGQTIFNSSASIDFGTVWDLESDCDYMVFVFGIDNSGNISGDITATEAATEAYGEDSEIKISDIRCEPYNITIHATPGSRVNNYCSFPVSKSDMDGALGQLSDYELAKNIRDFLEYKGHSFMKADGIFVHSGESDIELAKMFKLSSDTEYTIVTFGVSSFGVINTPIEITKASTTVAPPIKGSLASLTIDKCYDRSFDITIDKGDFSGLYYVGIYPKADFEGYFSGDVTKMAESFMEDEKQYGTDFEVADNTWIFDESATYNSGKSWKTSADTDYVIIAFGITPEGKVASNILEAYAKTLPMQDMSDNEISLSVHGVTSNSATLHATTTNDDIYYIGYIEKAKAENMSDKDIADYFLDYYGQMFDYLLGRGDRTLYTGTLLEPSTEYCAVAYGWSLGVNTELHRVSFTTLANEAAPALPTSISIPDVEFGELSVSEITNESYDLAVTPAADEDYVLAVLPSSVFTTCRSDEQRILATLDEMSKAGAEIEENGGDIYDAWGDFVKPLPTNITQRGGVIAGFDYTVIAFGIDKATLQPTTKCEYKRFSTPAKVAAKSPAAAKSVGATLVHKF